MDFIPMLLAAGFFSYTTSRNIGDAVLFTISPQWYFTLVTFGFLLTLFGIVAGGKYLAFVARKFLALIGIRPKRRPPPLAGSPATQTLRHLPHARPHRADLPRRRPAPPLRLL